jgi:Zn-finger protein
MSNQEQVTVSTEEMAKLQAELRAKKATVKAAKDLASWEAKISARNPAYVMGSVRKATDNDAEILGHAHGMVCLIKCMECGKTRLINKQDAFQVKHCKNCRKIARQNAAKKRRQAKALADTNPEMIREEMAKLQDQLAEINNDKPAKRTRRKAS